MATPQTRTRHIDNLALAAEARLNPGTPIRYPYPLASPKNLQSRIRRGKNRAFPEGFTTEIRDGHIYITYNGDN